MANGFGKQSKLHKNWLTMEARDGIDEKNNLNIKNLYTSLCLITATACGRREKNVDARADALGVMVALDVEQYERTEINRAYLKRFLSRLEHNEEFYISYIDRLADLIKTKVFAGEFEGISGLFKESQQYQDWLQEAGYLTAGTHLIDGIFHPLTDVKHCEKTGEPLIDRWGAASIMAAVVCGREILDDDEEPTDPSGMINTLIREGILHPETYQSYLTTCRFVDSVYLRLISEIFQMLEKDRFPA
jgi:hypothetical protein